jgi:subtilisin-like proprotein convertase family protein/subtilisin family serine protease
MTNETNADLGTYLWQGNTKLKIVKMPDRFTARMKPDVSPSTIARVYGVRHENKLVRQNLEVFEVEAAARDAAMDRIRAGSAVEFASHVYQFAGDPASRIYLTDEITIQFKPEISDTEIEELTAAHGLAFVKEIPDLLCAYVFRVTSEARENPIKIANRLLATEKVLVSEPNIAVPAQNFYTPTDPRFAEQWHLNHHGGPFLAADSHIDVVRAWDITRGERSVVVAVADDSCDLRHDDLQGTGKIVAPRDFAGRDFDPAPEHPEDKHGTACAAVAVAEENGRGVVGVAPGCALMPIRTTGMLDDTSIEDLFDWVVTHGASVVSCSWGPAAREFPLSLRKQNALHRAATVGRGGRGCVIVFAAGNANRPIDGVIDEHDWPDGQPNGPTRWYNGFAAHENVIAVAASTSLAKKAAYSNWGDQISVCAPSSNDHPQIFDLDRGRNIPTYPLIQTWMGRGIVTADRVGPAGYTQTDYTHTFGGTSSACPTVAGVAALALSANPDLTAREVREILEQTADKIVDHGRDSQLGNAFGAYDQRGHSQWFGYGKVNAFKAVTEAVRRRKLPAGPMLRRASEATVEIPDNDPAGLSDVIHFDDADRVASIQVEVDITHTYIGDLRLTLTAPSGTAVVLHDRHGSSTHHIRRIFDITTSPGLNRLTNQSVRGGWTLHIQDLAREDSGTLNRWEIAIAAQGEPDSAENVVELSEDLGETIPDNNPNGIERVLTTSATGRLKDVQVSVDITHPYTGDLIVTLVSPAGTQAPIHQRTGGSADNIITTYTTSTTPGLQPLRGESVSGSWRLKVADLEARDVGKLNRWGLRIAYAPSAAGAGAALHDPQTVRGEASSYVDDFKRIRGIGPTVESRLHTSGIYTFNQLAALSPDAILPLVSGLAGMSAERVNDWITQASKLSAALTPSERQPTVQSDTKPYSSLELPGGLDSNVERQRYATFTVQLLLDENNNVRRTHVVHVQDGESETWAGWKEQRLSIFFVDHAELPPPRISPSRPPDTDLTSSVTEPRAQIAELAEKALLDSPFDKIDVSPTPDFCLSLSDLLLEKFTASEADKQQQRRKRLHVQFNFHVSGSAIDQPDVATSHYTAQILIQNLDTDQVAVFTEQQGQLQPDQQFYIVTADLALPEAGRYRLHGTVQFPNLNICQETPAQLLRVVP